MLKRPVMVFWLLIATLIFLSSCATGPAFRKVELIPEGKSAAYFYRPSRFYGSASSPSIYDNGKKILDGLTNGGYWVYFVEPGKHVFSAKAAILEGSAVSIDSKGPGEEYYIRMDILSGAFISDAKFYRVYPEQGREEIIGCKFIE
jgi:hypothetical protein